MGVNLKAFDPTTKTYFKRNYGDALEKIVPTVYSIKDFDLSGMELDPLDLLLKTHLQAANNLSTILPISATPNFSAINTLSGIAPFFIKQNENTRITPFYFERDILDPLEFQLEAFNTSAEWKTYLDTHLLPALTLNGEVSSVTTPAGVSSNLYTAYGVVGASGLHEYLINSLGWFYFLNTSAPTGGTYDPSSFVSDSLTDLFIGSSLYITEGIKGFEEYLWKNYLDLPAFQRAEVVPTDFVSGVSSSTYTSGTQNLDRLKTLVEVLYSPLYADATDFKVKDAFEDYVVYDTFTPQEIAAGPFSKLLRVLGYAYQDVNSPIDKLESLYDIDNCPQEYLPHLADLIGWELLGADPARWRSQIRNAVRIYKAKGTKWATQLLLNSLFGESSDFNLSGVMYELYESYLPNLIYYLLSTGTSYFNQVGYKDNPFDLWTEELALEYGVTLPGTGLADRSTTDADSNIRRCVDKILKVLWEQHPAEFLLGDTIFPPPGSDPEFTFNYRGRAYPIPPYEEIRYYEKVQVSQPLLRTLEEQLQLFSVDSDLTTSTLNYIKSISVSSTDDISLGNRFVLFTSGFELPVNFTEILDDISNKRASVLPLWNAKSSHFDLHLSSNSYDQTTKSANPNTSLGIVLALKALNKTIPAHAIPRVKMFLEAFEYLQSTLFACPIPMYTPLDVFTSSTVVNAWALSGVNMTYWGEQVGLGHGLSSTNISRQYVDSVADNIMDGNGEPAWAGGIPKVNSAPRNNLRRRTFHMSLPRNGYYSRTGFDMPNSYEPSTPDLNPAVSAGALLLGYNYSGCEFQTPFPSGVSALHPVWSYCETSASERQFFGVDTSNTFHWRGLKNVNDQLQDGKCLLYIRREECPEIIRIMHRTKEKDALRDAYNHYKDVSGDWQASTTWLDPIQSLANSAFNGVSSWDTYSDYSFGSAVQEVYNRYAREFGRHGTAPHLVSGGYDHGGRTAFSHIYGPLLYNGNFTKDGVSSTMVASSFIQPSFGGVTSAVLYDSGASSVQDEASSLVIGVRATDGGEYRYPFALSGVEFCYRTEVPQDLPSPRPSFKVYRPSVRYLDETPGLISTLAKEATLEVDATNDEPDIVPRIRFDLSGYGNSSVSANLLLPDHDFDFKMKIARMNGQSTYQNKVWVWIHTIPEDGYFWSWELKNTWNYDNKYHNGEWVAYPVSSVLLSPIAEAYGNVEAMSTVFEVPKASPTLIANLAETDFQTIAVKFNTHNKQTRLSSNFKSYPKEYTPAFLHRTNQHYVVEVLFEAPIAGDSKYIIPEVTIIDQTLAQTALDEFTISYTDDAGNLHEKDITRTGLYDYRGIFKYMNSLAASSLGRGFATRIAADSSGIFEASGGSRLNYRYHPRWDPDTRDSYRGDDGSPAGIYNLVDFKEGSP